ncbi:Fic family protein [bacterium]|nr:Fic family protein [bacterium]
MTSISRSGHFVKQPGGFRAFIPASFPPSPPVRMNTKLEKLLSQADLAVGGLSTITDILPNTDLFLGMYVRREAVLSSQIEGTQSTLEEVLRFEIAPSKAERFVDAGEIVNYVAALNHGLERLADLPISLRLFQEIHAILMRSGRGSHSTPGEFRRSQNWIGPPGCTLETASFVPPPVPHMKDALGELEKFLHSDSLPILILAGLAHAQFETIHPFLDGNGRIGRLLITLLLCERGILSRPVLYLSHFFKRNRLEYYDRLTAIREKGDWEGWLGFFLRGAEEVAREAIETTRSIRALKERHQQLIIHRVGDNPRARSLLDLLFRRPMISVRLAEQELGCSYNTANKFVGLFEELGLLETVTGDGRGRVYSYREYLDLFDAREGAADFGPPWDSSWELTGQED